MALDHLPDDLLGVVCSFFNCHEVYGLFVFLSRRFGFLRVRSGSKHLCLSGHMVFDLFSEDLDSLVSTMSFDRVESVSLIGDSIEFRVLDWPELLKLHALKHLYLKFFKLKRESTKLLEKSKLIRSLFVKNCDFDAGALEDFASCVNGALTLIDCECASSNNFEEQYVGKTVKSFTFLKSFPTDEFLFMPRCHDDIEEIHVNGVHTRGTFATPKNLKVLTFVESLENTLYYPETLTVLDVEGNEFDYIPYLPNLVDFSCARNSLSSISLGEALVTLRCQSNKLASVVVPASLMYLDCSDNEIEEITGDFRSLLQLDCSRNKLTWIPFFPALIGLFCASNCFQTLNSFADSIVELNVSNNNLCQLSQLPKNLFRLECLGNDISDNLFPASIVELCANFDDNPPNFLHERIVAAKMKDADYHFFSIPDHPVYSKITPYVQLRYRFFEDYPSDSSNDASDWGDNCSEIDAEVEEMVTECDGFGGTDKEDYEADEDYEIDEEPGF